MYKEENQEILFSINQNKDRVLNRMILQHFRLIQMTKFSKKITIMNFHPHQFLDNKRKII